MDGLVPFGGSGYWLDFALLFLGRGADLVSTWIATPRLLLEANPLARRLGWRGGIIVNLLACAVFAVWPLPSVMIVTTSLLVAAHNLQSAWLMRALGEAAYRTWIAGQLTRASLPLYLGCLLGRTVLVAAVGAALVGFSHFALVPLAVGAGIVTYAVAVAFYTLLSVWRLRRISS